MEVIKVWSKKSGIIFDLLEMYSKKSQAPPVELLSLGKVISTDPKSIIENVQMELAQYGLAYS